MSAWTTYRLGDICTDVSYGYTQSANETKVGPKFLRITDIREGAINWETVPYCIISQKDYQKYRLEYGDIVVARTGATTGITETIKSTLEAVFASYLIRFRVNKDLADPIFVGYLLKSNLWREYVGSIVGGSAQPGANAKQFSDFVVGLPDLPTQKAIAEILSSLDDKIELNNEMNKTLEELAQTLFKRWFVDFEFPDENGNPYKSSGGKMVESELGMIPKGWKADKLESHLYIKGRIGWKGLKKSEYEKLPTGYSIINGSDFNGNQISYDKAGWITKARYEESPEIILQENDILITKDGTIGKLAFIYKLEQKTTVASGIFVIRSSSNSISNYYLWSYFNSPYFRDLVKHRIDGSVIPHLYQKDFVEMVIPVPDSENLARYEDAVYNIFSSYFNNLLENNIIEKIRNTLLPKLISGQLKVGV